MRASVGTYRCDGRAAVGGVAIRDEGTVVRHGRLRGYYCIG